MDRTVIVDTARSWLGTPFIHQARLKGVGVDCVGLLIGVCRELGLVEDQFDIDAYPRIPDGISLMYLAEHHMTKIPRGQMQPGDVVVVAFDKFPQHFGIVGNYNRGGLSMIHAASAYGKVVEQRLMFTNAMKFVAAFKLPGVH